MFLSGAAGPSGERGDLQRVDREREGETETKIGRGTEGQRERGTEGQRDSGTEGQGDRGTEGPKDRGTMGPQESQSSRYFSRRTLAALTGHHMLNEASACHLEAGRRIVPWRCARLVRPLSCT